jgi:uncharacterized protein YyaL (SSP411 family)
LNCSVPNRLLNEKSPYLLQHAHNPVDWYPWGPAAFEKARREDKPLLVSIGYATCHWCHVMERESFEDPAVAALMNQELVNVKVDREERPDVDRVHMTALQALTGQGGWPLNMFLTPDGKPFLGGTYFPPADRGGRPGWSTLVQRIGAAWRDPAFRAQMVERGDRLHDAVADLLTAAPDPAEGDARAVVDGVWGALRASHDDERGGFSPAPKFPMPVYPHFLLRCLDADPARRDDTLKMLTTTLGAMARGGLFDQAGGGFHRYSTDGDWHVPHFEKMLYDNAQLAVNYIEAHRATGDVFYEETARRTLAYTRDALGLPGGGFASGEDADSLVPGGREKKEGAFYLWTSSEIESLLGDRAAAFSSAFGVLPDGNARSDPFGEFAGHNILFRAAEGDFFPEMKKLFDARARRPRPFLDDKVITSWNALAAAAFARGTSLDASFGDVARRALQFLKDNLWDAAAETLFRRWREGERAVPGLADDYAFTAHAAVEVYSATGDPAWLFWAEELLTLFAQRFMDGPPGVVHVSAAGHDPHLSIRARDEGDNVEPASSSVAALNFLRLGRLLDRADFLRAAEAIARAVRPTALRSPRAYAAFAAAELAVLHPPAEVIVVGRPEEPGTRARLAAERRVFRPDAILLQADQGPRQALLATRLPHLKDLRVPPGVSQTQICQDGVCKIQ